MNDRSTDITLTRTDAPMYSGGAVAYEVRLDGRWIGWVGDARAWTGSGYGGRRWWACWRTDGDQHARWSSDPVHRTRRDALIDLMETCLVATTRQLDAAYAEAQRELAEATTAEAREAAADVVRDHEKGRRLVGLPID